MADRSAIGNAITDRVHIIERVLHSLEHDNAKKVEGDIIARLHDRFGVPRTLALSDAAQAFAAAASAEDFLGETLRLLRPYVAMLRDIYRLLERAGATESGTAEQLRLDDRGMRRACRDLPISQAFLHRLRETYLGWREHDLIEVNWDALHRLASWDGQFYGTLADLPVLQLLTFAPAVLARLRQQLAQLAGDPRRALVAEVEQLEITLTALGARIDAIVQADQAPALPLADLIEDAELPTIPEPGGATPREYAVHVNDLGGSSNRAIHLLSLAQARSGVLPPPTRASSPSESRANLLGGLLVLLTVLNGRIERPWPSADRIVRLLDRASADPAWLRGLVDQLLAELEQIAPVVGRLRGQALLERVQDVIDLPFWKDRARLYEVWVLVRTSRAVEASGVLRAVPRLERDGDTWVLRLPKSDGRRPIFDIEVVGAPPRSIGLLWFQRRTAERRRRFQSYEPDVRCTGLPPRHRDLFLVECKDRADLARRQDGKGFEDVARRYLEASDAELLWLVNYARFGEPASTVEENDGRTGRFADQFYPGNTPAEFDQTIAAHLRWRLAPVLHAGSPAMVAPATTRLQAPAPPAGGPQHRESTQAVASRARIELRWEATPRDLDLHLWRESWPEVIHFGQRGALEGEPWAQLAGDCTTGFGPEQIQVAQLAPVRYSIAVHNFSADRPLAGCAARLTLELDGKPLMVKAPAQGEGRWWHVLEIDGANGLVSVTNEIRATSPWGAS